MTPGLPGAKAPPMEPLGIWMGFEGESGLGDEGIEFCLLGGGAPCRPRWKAFMRAAMSEDTFKPLPLFENVGATGRRAALRAPSGVDEGVIWAVIAADADTERGDSRGGSRERSVAGEEDMFADVEGSDSGGFVSGLDSRLSELITRKSREDYRPTRRCGCKQGAESGGGQCKRTNCEEEEGRRLGRLKEGE